MLVNKKFNIKSLNLIAGLLFFIVLPAIFLLVNNSAFAASINAGFSYVENAHLGNTDPRDMIVNLVKVAFTFLGIIAVVIFMYGGWLWMSSAGDQSKVDKAKEVLKGAIIGLIIIFASYGIVAFVISQMLNNGDGNPTLPPGGGPAGGFGVLGSCSVISVYPEPNQKDVPRNTVIMITFREEVNFIDICNGYNNDGDCIDAGESLNTDNVRLFHADETSDCTGAVPFTCVSQVTDVDVYTNDNKTFVFDPVDYIGSPSEYIEYSVYFSGNIEKLNIPGESIFNSCSSDYLLWSFEVNNKVDLTPPVVQEVFPTPDNAADNVTVGAAIAANGSITVVNLPNIFQSASYVSVLKNPPAAVWVNASVTMDENSNASGDFIVTVLDDNITVQLSQGSVLLGSAEFDSDGNAEFDGYFTFSAPGHTANNSWSVIGVVSAQDADTLMIGSTLYSFSNVSGINKIVVGPDNHATAQNICNVINGIDSPENVAVECVPAAVPLNVATIVAKIAGEDGNSIVLNSSNLSAITTIGMENGADSTSVVIAQGGATDKARNAVVQVTFNEAVNPMQVSGIASDLHSYIRVVNNTGAISGSACGSDNDCLSFNCDDATAQCVNDYLDGSFVVSNQYRTVEFISNNQCGVNACGEPIYCLPENSNIRVELVAAVLSPCGADNCASKVPYNTCVGGHCQDVGTGELFPGSDPGLMNGIMDAALNSLDGDRSGDAEGPIDFFNENNDAGNGDNYRWSFFISDEIDLSPPIIKVLDPNLSESGIDSEQEVEIDFSELMMAQSLSSGSRVVSSEIGDTTHKLINIWALNGIGVGYWVTSQNIDNPAFPDGISDYTKAIINHSSFLSSTSYRSQAGSGVRDIYQNCYMPSEGPGAGLPVCGVDDANPSCCDGAPINSSVCP